MLTHIFYPESIAIVKIGATHTITLTNFILQQMGKEIQNFFFINYTKSKPIDLKYREVS